MNKVLITGGAGMVGTYLAKYLHGIADVVVLDNFSRGKNKIDGVEYITGDAGDLEICYQAMNGCDIVFNLAAEVAGVGFNQKHHCMMFNNNMRLLSVPLQAAVDCGVSKFFQTSSVCIYAPLYLSPSIERNGWSMEPTSANIGYSLAKRMGERLALWYQEEFGLDIFIGRPSNIYGRNDYFDERAHVIPALIKKCLDGHAYVTVKGNGKTFREFIYAGDVAEAMVHIVKNGQSGETYNIGTDGQTRVNTRELLSMIEFIIGVKKERRFIDDGHTGDDDRWSDCSKLKATGWSYRTSLIDGLKMVINWYQDSV
jgi:GDP-L-fucose synthase